MHAIGLDMGTTTISAVVLDGDSGKALQAVTERSEAAIGAAQPWARLQDPARILRQAQRILEQLLAAHPSPRSIGLTGQMHGILYLDAQGRAASPLYTWQDGRGDLAAASGISYAQELSKETGMALATGYGAVTHHYNLRNGLVPKSAASVATIMDYVGAQLTGRATPLTHASNAHSFGAPDWAGIRALIHATDRTACLGETRGGVPVAVAIGDNQASFIGSVRSATDTALVNVGTGGQLSVAARNGADAAGMESRPYVDGGSLLVTSSLCGGRAYALLERLFRDIAALAGAPAGSLFEAMNALADAPLSDPLAMDTRFAGTRQDPSLRGAITGISEGNLTPAHLVQAALDGMAGELCQPFPAMAQRMEAPPRMLVGSGNAIRKNPALRRRFEAALGLKMRVPAHREEAAYGAALFSLAACGERASVAAAQRVIQYEETSTTT